MGLTEKIYFNRDGARDEFTLDVIEMSTQENIPTTFQKTATWNGLNKDKVRLTRNYTDVLMQISQSIQNKTFIIVSHIGMPYLREMLGSSMQFNINLQFY